jgi:diguanylate cyclase (GGDEF)-like protein
LQTYGGKVAARNMESGRPGSKSPWAVRPRARTATDWFQLSKFPDSRAPDAVPYWSFRWCAAYAHQRDPRVDSELKILFVDDEPADIAFEQYELERSGIAFTSHIAVNERELRQELVQFNPDIVLCDYTIPGLSGLRALETVQALRSSTPVLMISGSIIEDTVIECLKCGATDYLLKASLRRLGPAVRRAVGETRRHIELQSRIEQLAHYDTLTGLPNLALLDQAVSSAIDRARETRCLVALVVLNLDQFRFVDERFGRRAADAVLKDISAVLLAQSGGGDSVARVGSDEFLLVVSGFSDPGHVMRRVQAILKAVAKPRLLAEREFTLTASAGVALYPADGADFETLLSKASAALHEAKTASPGGMQFHSIDATQRAQRSWQMERDLRGAIRHGELTLFYQPQFNIGNGEICGVEALARWFLADGEAIPPSVFIPLAEKTGLIGALGGWALFEGCRTSASWPGGSMRVPLCINVSAQQIGEPFTCEIATALESSGWPPEQLELEITESVLVRNPHLALSCLAQWKSLGVRIAVDDFGTGYSGLSYLSQLPIDRLKLDQSFVRRIAKHSKDSTILGAVIALGRELGFTIIAEGVETEEQLRTLRELGCHQAQGFLLGCPLPESDTRILLSEGRFPPHRASEHAQGASVARC